jgi:hypothetical protein
MNANIQKLLQEYPSMVYDEEKLKVSFRQKIISKLKSM